MINLTRAKIKLNKPRLNKRSIIIIVLLLIVIILCVVLLFKVKWYKKPPSKKIVYDGGKEQIQDLSEGLVSIPPNAKSYVCDKITPLMIKKETSINVSTSKVSIPNTQTKEGEVSACGYSVDNSNNNSPFTSMIITSRLFANAPQADKAYNVLKNFDKNKNPVNNFGYINQNNKQLIILNNNRLTILAPSLRDNSKNVDQDFYVKVATLLKEHL